MPTDIRKVGRRIGESTRVSVTFPVEQYRRILEMAEKKDRSMAWVVRKAVEESLEEPATSGGRGR